MTTRLTSIGIETFIAADWENLSDEDAQQEFENWADLSTSQNLDVQFVGAYFNE